MPSRRRLAGWTFADALTPRLEVDGALGSGDYPCFVASQRFLDAMREDGVRVDLGGRVEMLEPVENGLSLDDAPAYA